MTTPSTDPQKLRAAKLGLYGLLSDWPAVADQPWLEELLQREEAGRQQRSLERRLLASRIGRFKSIADFNFDWPKKIDREQLDDLFSLSFIDTATNVILLGPNGVGKSIIAKNLLYQAVVRGATARFVTPAKCSMTSSPKKAPPPSSAGSAATAHRTSWPSIYVEYPVMWSRPVIVLSSWSSGPPNST